MDSNNPMVTIVIPAYNAGQYIGEAIQKVMVKLL